MEGYNIYRDIAERTNGDIYIGVVGPVRTGKSTFIKKFMDLLVLPNINDPNDRARARDELPQSAAGRTIMTTEPKFVPNDAVEIAFGDGAKFKVRLIDCVGYIVNGALGQFEEDTPRMVHTPWFKEEIPFDKAAEIGTQKVICDHSTIGLVMTTDGSITEIEREEYLEAESRVIEELKALNKPFIVLVNSAEPTSITCTEVCKSIEAKHQVPAMPINCAALNLSDIHQIIEKVLYEFPIAEIGINLPKWMNSLPRTHALKAEIFDVIKKTLTQVHKIHEIKSCITKLTDCDYIDKVYFDHIDMGTGKVLIETVMPDALFYKILSETSGFEITGEDTLIELMKELSRVKKEYDKISYAMHEVREKGYGIVTPSIEELTLAEPEIVKQGNRFGVRLCASAPSIHIIRYKPKCKILRYKTVMTTGKTGGMHLAYKAIMLAAPQGAPKRFANRITVTGCPTSGAVFYLPFWTCSPVNGSMYSFILI